MAHHYRELLIAARLLVGRQPGQRGRLPAARLRRSVSTAYYAIFHFVQEECALRLVGSEAALLRRRRMFIRTFTHKGMKLALQKVVGAKPASDVIDFLRSDEEPVTVPPFASAFASAFVEAQTQRHAADYDLNAELGELDARRMIETVEAAINDWIAARSAVDRDFKHALCLLIALKGRLRADDA